MFRKTLTLALGLTLAAATLGAADTYIFGGKDAAHTDVGFTIKHWVINKVHGNFDKFDGTLVYDDKNIEKSSVNVTIDASSIDTRNSMRDAHLRKPEFFDVEKNPNLTFKSTKVEKAADGKSISVTGDLTMRGVTKSVVLNVVITGTVEDPRGDTRMGFEATTTVNRMDYGIAWNMKNKTGTSMLGDQVDIMIAGEAIKQK
jgi:polyisoprenoid-binding protein YceI